MNISYKNSPVVINSRVMYANQLTLTETSEFQRVDELSYPAPTLFSNVRPQTEFSLDGYLTSGMLRNIDLTGLTGFAVKCGTFSLTSGFMNEFSVNAQAVSPITCSLKGIAFESPNRNATPAVVSFEQERGAHGAMSYVQTGEAVMYNTDLLGFTISFTQGIAPFYQIGTRNLLGIDYNGGEIRCTLNGTGIQRAVDFGCGNATDVVLNLKNLCNTSLGDITISGFKVNNSSLTVNENDDVVGNLELIRYY